MTLHEVLPVPTTDGAVRPLSNRDLGEFEAHLLRLGRQCRQSRFGSQVTDRFLHEYARRVDFSNTAVLGYFHQGELRGVAEVRSLQKTWCAEAEVAFSVEADWRAKGIGTALMRAALSAARLHDVSSVFLICNPQNRPMQRIAEKVGAAMRFADGDCIGEVAIPHNVELPARMREAAQTRIRHGGANCRRSLSCERHRRTSLALSQPTGRYPCQQPSRPS